MTRLRGDDASLELDSWPFFRLVVVTWPRDGSQHLTCWWLNLTSWPVDFWHILMFGQTLMYLGHILKPCLCLVPDHSCMLFQGVAYDSIAFGFRWVFTPYYMWHFISDVWYNICMLLLDHWVNNLRVVCC